MFGDYMLNKLLDKVKEIIGIEQFDNTNILINTDDKLSDDITFKKVVILMTSYVINNMTCYKRLSKILSTTIFRTCIV